MKTKYIDLPTMAKYLKSVGAETVIKRLVPYWNDFDKVPRMAHHSPVGVIELMPIGDSKTYSFKYVNGHPENPKHNFLTVMAIGVLAEVCTGFPLLLSELTLTTAVRTAATSVMAAKYLAKPNPKKMNSKLLDFIIFWGLKKFIAMMLILLQQTNSWIILKM